MAKIATAQIEIKPVLNEQALADICRRIEDAIAGAIGRGYATEPDAASQDRSGTEPPMLVLGRIVERLADRLKAVEQAESVVSRDLRHWQSNDAKPRGPIA